MSRRRHGDRTRAVTAPAAPPAPTDPAARLAAAIDQLTQPSTVEVKRDPPAQPGTAEVPPLIEQLIDQIGGSSNRDANPAAGIYRSVIAGSVVELLDEIARITRWPRLAHPYQRPALADHLAEWRPAGADTSTAEYVETWVTRATTLLNPPRRWSHPAPCPACGRDIAHVRDDTGEVVRRPALELDLTTGTARCLVTGCNADWDRDHIRLLAQVLREQQPAPPTPQIRSSATGRGGAWLTPQENHA